MEQVQKSSMMRGLWSRDRVTFATLEDGLEGRLFLNSPEHT